MTVQQLPEYLKQHCPAIGEKLQGGTYRPGGGVRKLGIPTVLDRFIQQAVMQVLQRKWTGHFPNTAMV